MLSKLSELARLGRLALTLTATSAALLAGASAWAQSADLVGVHYPPSLKIEGTTVNLNGSGVAYRAVAKLYTVGLYLPKKTNSAEGVLSTNAPMQLRFVMLQGMRVDELGKVVTKGIEVNSSREEFFKLIPSIRTMGEQFSRIKRLNVGDVFAIDYVPQRGTMFYVNNQPVGLPMQDAQYFPAVLRVWLGNRPNSTNMKDALLDHKAAPVLDALL
jgi:hypothetical protein